MNYRPDDQYKGWEVDTPVTLFKKAINRLDPKGKRRNAIAKRVKNIGGKALDTLRDAGGDLIYRMRTSGMRREPYLFDDDSVMSKGFSNSDMNYIDTQINEQRAHLFSTRQYSALDGFDCAVRLFAEAAKTKKEEPKDRKKSFWQKNKKKILTGAGVLAGAAGAGYGGYKWGQQSGYDQGFREGTTEVEKLQKLLTQTEADLKYAKEKGLTELAALKDREIAELKKQVK